MSDLPDDIEILKKIIVEQRARLLSSDLQIERLKLQLARLRRVQFGRSSEQIDAQIAQLELTLEDFEIRAASVPPEVTVVLPERVKPVRRPLPESLPREPLVHATACNCPDCGSLMSSLGEDVSEMLERLTGRRRPTPRINTTWATIADKVPKRPPTSPHLRVPAKCRFSSS